MTPSLRHALALLGFACVIASAGRAGSEPRIIDLSIRNGELPSEARVVRVRQGDDVTLRWSTDRALTLHVHGYDLETKLAAGATASMRLRAKVTGRFPIEVHADRTGAGRTLGYLEVHPR